MANATMRKCNGKKRPGGQTSLGGAVPNNTIEPIKLDIGVQYDGLNREEIEAHQLANDSATLDLINTKISENHMYINELEGQKRTIKKEIQELENEVRKMSAYNRNLENCVGGFNTNIPDFAFEDVLNHFKRFQNVDYLINDLSKIVQCWPRDNASWISTDLTHLWDEITKVLHEGVENSRNGDPSFIIKRLVDAYNNTPGSDKSKRKSKKQSRQSQPY